MAESRAESDRPPSKIEKRAFRWQGLFQDSREAIFLQNPQRRLFFVNRAWEELTGRPAGEVRGLVCKRHKDPEPGSPEELASALAAPAEVAAGKTGRWRRLLPVRGSPSCWCDLDFFPVGEAGERAAVLGKITPISPAAAADRTTLPEDLVALREKHAQRFRIERLAGPQAAGLLRRVVEQALLASQTRAPVLIVGEPGTGKQWLARAIHYQSTARESTFAALDCGHLPPGALAGLLFGAGGLVWRTSVGTLYLKEPGRLPRDLQDRLSALAADFGSKGPRLISSASADLSGTGPPRDDLHCALGTLVLELPPLRNRAAADLPWLVEHLLERIAGTGAGAIPTLTPEAWELLYAYRWPGNIRELFAVLAGALDRVAGQPAPGRIDAGSLPAYLRLAGAPGPAPARALPLDRLLEQGEKRLIGLALRMAQGNKTRAAEVLSIWRPRLLRRMEALGIGDSEEGKKA